MNKKTPATPAKTSDLEKYKLKGKVKQQMLITFKAHQKDGEVIKGRLDLDDVKLNYITTFNEKGNKIKTDDFSDALIACGKAAMVERASCIKASSMHTGARSGSGK